MKALSYKNKCCIGVALLTTLILVLSSIKNNVVLLNNKPYFKAVQTIENKSATERGRSENLKYILQWTNSKNVPFVYMEKGQDVFIQKKCTFTNCYVTDNENFLGDVTKFDLVAFAGTEVIRYHEKRLPQRRSPHQKYVFASIESSANYPICSNRFDGYFNWTWTYRLESDARWGYMLIRDKNDKIIGPRKEMHWIQFKDMDPVTEEFKEQLKSKSKAAAWFVSNCRTKSKREMFARDLQEELKQYNLFIDVYGSCGTHKCSRDNEDECYKLLKDKYYFYLSFENSFAEDYVTEKLLNAVKHNTVPIVYGGANYTRFMPDGMYLNARVLGAKDLAAKMNELIKNRDQYAEYFKWQKYYSYHKMRETPETDEYCSFCTILNNEEKVKTMSVYDKFKKWWDPPGVC